MKTGRLDCTLGHTTDLLLGAANLQMPSRPVCIPPFLSFVAFARKQPFLSGNAALLKQLQENLSRVQLHILPGFTVNIPVFLKAYEIFNYHNYSEDFSQKISVPTRLLTGRVAALHSSRRNRLYFLSEIQPPLRYCVYSRKIAWCEVQLFISEP